MLEYALVLAFVWGVFWAVFLQYVPLGKFLAEKRTWITVVIGSGVNMGILFMVIDWRLVLQVLAVWGVSAIGIIVRSIANECHEERELIEAVNGNGQ